MEKNHFEQFYDDYTHIMLFVNSNKLKLREIEQEMSDIKLACDEVLDNADIEYSLRSLRYLKSRLDLLMEKLNAILYQYSEIDTLLHQVDVFIADYNEINIQIDLYELNGIENDLLDVKNINNRFNGLKLEIKHLIDNIEDKINRLEG